MQIKTFDTEKANLEVHVDELVILNNTLNEIGNGLHLSDSDLMIRMGVTREAVKALLDQINQLVNQMDALSPSEHGIEVKELFLGRSQGKGRKRIKEAV